MNLFLCKANVKRFGFDNLPRDFNIMRIEITGAKKNAFNGRFIYIHLAFLI